MSQEIREAFHRINKSAGPDNGGAMAAMGAIRFPNLMPEREAGQGKIIQEGLSDAPAVSDGNNQKVT